MDRIDIERLAIVAADEWSSYAQTSPLTWDDYPEWMKDRWRNIVRAVTDAI